MLSHRRLLVECGDLWSADSKANFYLLFFPFLGSIPFVRTVYYMAHYELLKIAYLLANRVLLWFRLRQPIAMLGSGVLSDLQLQQILLELTLQFLWILIPRNGYDNREITDNTLLTFKTGVKYSPTAKAVPLTLLITFCILKIIPSLIY